jgi:hypothetical protein
MVTGKKLWQGQRAINEFFLKLQLKQDMQMYLQLD